MLRALLKKLYDNYIGFHSRRHTNFFKKHGMRPWSRGYSEYRTQELIKVLNDQEMMQAFKQSRQLPEGYGFWLYVRLIEYPWVLSRLPEKKCQVLDAGSALNFDYIISNQIIEDKELYIMTLFPEPQCFWERGISYVYSDLRDNPFNNGYFDIIVCISTLEHVGMDNTMYAETQEFRKTEPASFIRAVKEFNRILKPGGLLYITVPYGERANYGFFQQFDASLVRAVLEAFEGSSDEISYYQYLESGWVLSEKSKCSTSQYFDIYRTKYFDKQSVKDYDADYAAAARAVACMKLVKE
jgi:SAM-dependent methyltransferase